jgi:hypothetical protein
LWYIFLGRLAWQVFRGSGTEELISTGLWASSIGMSAVVLQIPRLKMSDVLARLEYCEQKYKDLKSISKDWKLSSEWSYARLVRLPSPTNGIRFSLNWKLPYLCLVFKGKILSHMLVKSTLLLFVIFKTKCFQILFLRLTYF